MKDEIRKAKICLACSGSLPVVREACRGSLPVVREACSGSLPVVREACSGSLPVVREAVGHCRLYVKLSVTAGCT
jgi:hypothetical protein